MRNDETRMTNDDGVAERVAGRIRHSSFSPLSFFRHQHLSRQARRFRHSPARSRLRAIVIRHSGFVIPQRP